MDAKTNVKMRCCEELGEKEVALQELRSASYFEKKLNGQGWRAKNTLQNYISHLEGNIRQYDFTEHFASRESARASELNKKREEQQHG